MKGETVKEITGCARAMRAMATPIKIQGTPITIESIDGNKADDTILDTCGTGGDGANTFNISTAVAIVAAGAGLTVAKHGNRAISSKCGSADVLEKLGVNLKLSPDNVRKCISETGIGFLFAPLYHLAMKHAILPRREIGIRTIFNLLGPLANPAGANVQILGVYDNSLTSTIAEVLRLLGLRRAMVVHGAGTLDEFSLLGSTQVSELRDGKVETYLVTPEEFGLPSASLDELEGGDVERNADIILSIFKGQQSAKMNAVLLNAAAVFVITNRASNFKEGVEVAKNIIYTGKAMEKLNELILTTNRLGQESNIE
jgi:anthranilate phosphoribosyltransferase